MPSDEDGTDSADKLETTPPPRIGDKIESNEENKNESNNKSNNKSNNNNALSSKTEKSKTEKKKKKPKGSVKFTELSTLYVFQDEYKYNARDTWYSSHDLKAFRADAFLTVNWMVTKSITEEDDAVSEQQQQQQQEQPEDELQASCNIGENNNSSGDSDSDENNEDDPYNYCYYSNKYGYDRQKELKRIARRHRHQLLTMGDYEFCPRGVECRTPMGRFVKNKRRLDAMRVVLLYQQMQKQHRRERKRAMRRKQQAQHNRRRESADDLRGVLRHDRHHHHRHPAANHSSADPEAVRRIEADIDAMSLASVYGSYCEESAFEALERGRADASEAGMPRSSAPIADDAAASDNSITVTKAAVSAPRQQHQRPRSQPKTGETLVECPSLCDEEDEDEEDEFMDNLVSLSFVEREDDDDDDDDEYDDRSNASSSTGGSESETSISLADLLFGPHDTEGDGHCQRSSEQQVENSEVEIEFVEDDAERPHRIYWSSDPVHSVNADNEKANSSSNNNNNNGDAVHHRALKRPSRSNSWSHPAITTRSSSSSSLTPAPVIPPESSNKSVVSHSSFSSLELGGLFDWW